MMVLQPASTTPEPTKSDWSKVGIAHPICIALKVVQGMVNRFLSRLIAWTQPSERGQDGFDFALIELLAAPSGPIGRFGASLAVDSLGQFSQMLVGMIEVDNLDGIEKVFIGNVPDPRCSITHDNDPLSALQAAPHRFSINAWTELLGGFNRSHIRGGVFIASRASLIIQSGLRKDASQFGFTRFCPLRGLSGFAPFALACDHRHARTIDGDVKRGHCFHARQLARQRGAALALEHALGLAADGL